MSSTPLDWPYRFSRRANTARRSVMRELMPLTARPDIISFAGGLPAPDLFPIQDYQTCVDHVLTTEGKRALQYGPPFMPLKEATFNFVRPHSALKVELTHSDSHGRKWQSRTSAMAAGLTDHVWTLEELLSYRIPPSID